jgi:hypothetical protein
MNRNEGTTDRIVRAILGIGALAWAGSMGWSSTGAIVLLVLAGLLIVTAAIGFCPLYHLLGMSTYRPEHVDRSSERVDHIARH